MTFYFHFNKFLKIIGIKRTKKCDANGINKEMRRNANNKQKVGIK